MDIENDVNTKNTNKLAIILTKNKGFAALWRFLAT